MRKLTPKDLQELNTHLTTAMQRIEDHCNKIYQL